VDVINQNTVYILTGRNIFSLSWEALTTLSRYEKKAWIFCIRLEKFCNSVHRICADWNF